MTHNKLFIWDLDGTLYPDAPNDLFVDYCAATFAKVVSEKHLPQFSVDEAQRIAAHYYQTYGNSIFGFEKYYGVNAVNLHHDFFDALSSDILNIQQCNQTVEAFNKVAGEHCILSHANQKWVHHILSLLNKQHIFPKEKRFCLEDVDMKIKSQTPDALQYVMNKFNHTPETTVLIEDSLSNLKVAHSIGVHTVYLKHHKSLDTKPNWVTEVYTTPLEYLNSLK